MAPLLFALALVMQDAPAPEASPDGPVATAVPRKQTAPPVPIQGGPVSAPADDYGYVGWCYGSLAAYVDLYELAMPEVIRIERAWPTPSTEANIKEVYPGQREEAKRDLVQFRRALEAAEKASPTPIQAAGAAAIKRGRAVWTGAATVPRAQLAQFWMSWSPPARCMETAKALETRSNLFGQALTVNTPAAAPIVAPPPPPDEPAPAMLLTTAEPPAGPILPPSSDLPTLETAAPTADLDAPAETAPDAIAGDAPAEPAEDAALSAGGPAPDGPVVEENPSEAPASETADASGSAIDALLPAGETPEAPPMEEAAADDAPVDAENGDEPAADEPAAEDSAPDPAAPGSKDGLKETAPDLRGPL